MELRSLARNIRDLSPKTLWIEIGDEHGKILERVPLARD
jgi:hypothetical protein